VADRGGDADGETLHILCGPCVKIATGPVKRIFDPDGPAISFFPSVS
jgi:hypothetical protein